MVAPRPPRFETRDPRSDATTTVAISVPASLTHRFLPTVVHIRLESRVPYRTLVLGVLSTTALPVVCPSTFVMSSMPDTLARTESLKTSKIPVIPAHVLYHKHEKKIEALKHLKETHGRWRFIRR